jgi:hypothetical protein
LSSSPPSSSPPPAKDIMDDVIDNMIESIKSGIDKMWEREGVQKYEAWKARMIANGEKIKEKSYG